jgi:transcriptional regulator with XRE-family HTH domain
MTEPEKRAFVVRSATNRRHLSAEQKEELRKTQQRIAGELYGQTVDGTDQRQWSQEQIGAMLGVSRVMVTEWLSISDVAADNANTPAAKGGATDAPTKPKKKRKKKNVKLDADDKTEIWRLHQSGKTQTEIAAEFKVTQGRIAQVLKAIEAQIADQQGAEEDATKAEQDAQEIVIAGDYRDKGPAVADNSVDLIFTDPPYNAKTVPQYADLARFAARVLVPGGSLITYLGHYAIHDVCLGGARNW